MLAPLPPLGLCALWIRGSAFSTLTFVPLAAEPSLSFFVRFQK